MQNRKNKKLNTAIIVLAMLILAAAGVLVGMKIGHDKRNSQEASQPTYEAAVSSTEASHSEESVISEVSSASAATYADVKNEENRKKSQVLKGAIEACIGNVSETYASIKAAEGAAAAGSAGTAAAQVTPAGTTSNVTVVSSGKTVCIDPGHQDHGMSDTEPNGPGSSTMKAKLTSGTEGVSTGKNEYEVNLEVSLKLRDILKSRGYNVVMTRETNNVNISNVERAEIANNANADIFIRVHCNSLDTSSVTGALAYQPTSGNPYLSSDVIAGSQRLASALLTNQIAVTGQRNAGIIDGDDMTGINWAKMPVTIIEIGFMSNPDEDQFICSDDGQNKIAQGLANGVDAYFAG